MDTHIVDGVHNGAVFGDNCERRVFFPSSIKSNVTARREDTALFPKNRMHPRSRIPRPDPVAALGLFSPSPYAGLKKLLAQVHKGVPPDLMG